MWPAAVPLRSTAGLMPHTDERATCLVFAKLEWVATRANAALCSAPHVLLIVVPEEPAEVAEGHKRFGICGEATLLQLVP